MKTLFLISALVLAPELALAFTTADEAGLNMAIIGFLVVCWIIFHLLKDHGYIVVLGIVAALIFFGNAGGMGGMG